MSKNKKTSFWQRLKYLVSTKVKRSDRFTMASSTDSTPDSSCHVTYPFSLKGSNSSNSFKSCHSSSNSNHSNDSDSDGSQSGFVTNNTKHQSNTQAHNKSVANMFGKDRTEQTQMSKQRERRQTGKQAKQHTKNESARMIGLESQDAVEGTDAQPNRQGGQSDKPITDSILDYLDASELSYYYHTPIDSNTGIEQADKQQINPDDKMVRNVQHISMAMRYHTDKQSDNTSNSPQSIEQLESDQVEADDAEWGCVIRIHEHTQLVAIYGVLPFQLPPSHLQAGLTLAAQLNYDMMLGCVEIDIRDGEIRFKNSLDFEPIIQSHQGKVPAVVISYLLKGVMAMTASFIPIFSDLINSNPKEFELSELLDKHRQQQLDSLFFLASTTPQ